MGTPLYEGGKWLLRHEGGGGNKVPLMGTAEVLSELKHDEPRIFDGFYSRDRFGTVVAAYVKVIKTFD